MAENKAKQAPFVIRLTSSRAPVQQKTENDKSERQSSGGGGEMCFGDEWLDDWADEAILHKAMDAIDIDLKRKSDSEHCSTSSRQHDRTVDKPEEDLRSICRCNNSSDSSSAEEDSKTKSVPDDVEKSTGVEEGSAKTSTKSEITQDGDSDQNVCEKCHKITSKRGENEITTNDSLTMQAKKAKFQMDPLRQFKGKYLWVSDLTSQAWCERQLLYDCTFEGPVEILETEAMKVGTEMHLKRELEVHSIKQIAVKTREDKWAIKFLNILSAVNQLLLGGGGGGASRCVVREMPIFGKPFQNGAFVVGVIDEIRYNSRDQLEVVEFKTRAKSRTVPSRAQRKTHKLQVMLYKQLFDEAVCGLLTKETILETIGLDPEASVNDEIAAHALRMDLVLPKFGDYVDITLERFQFLSKIDSLAVEYSSQDDKEPFAINDYTFDPIWLKERLEHYNAFWVGKREVEGVELEEVWKCNFCNYKEGCDWRQKMHERCLSRKSASKVQIEITK